ncbi:MAG: hypothetical protein AVDCRST_MAG53-1960 [uncultured Solirubrobacteraceae bacterium]|uniref:Na+-translocating membrane potential-generating system MpsC domain-containing protein n=1 Tax=uncultured Solirubrobacteraceae bacterium TaxID=1162706 RepID=A0A6J4SPU4_9ACTN|nr:MAG: hypothetical protein AVDCRST_MAG53-1960 [uncultured Solirubrobacteraceae bacterium]
MSEDVPDQRLPEEGGRLLARISTEMVKAQKQFFGKGPTQAKSYFVDDMLFIVMQGGLTTAEKTMMEFDEADRVRDFRQTFENRMTERLTEMIEQLTRRKVLTYQSQILFEPDRIIEMFVFDDRAPAELIEATAEAQLRGEPAGQVSTEDVALDDPSSSGQS